MDERWRFTLHTYQTNIQNFFKLSTRQLHLIVLVLAVLSIAGLLRMYGLVDAHASLPLLPVAGVVGMLSVCLAGLVLRVMAISQVSVYGYTYSFLSKVFDIRHSQSWLLTMAFVAIMPQLVWQSRHPDFSHFLLSLGLALQLCVLLLIFFGALHSRAWQRYLYALVTGLTTLVLVRVYYPALIFIPFVLLLIPFWYRFRKVRRWLPSFAAIATVWLFSLWLFWLYGWRISVYMIALALSEFSMLWFVSYTTVIFFVLGAIGLIFSGWSVLINLLEKQSIAVFRTRIALLYLLLAAVVTDLIAAVLDMDSILLVTVIWSYFSALGVVYILDACRLVIAWLIPPQRSIAGLSMRTIGYISCAFIIAGAIMVSTSYFFLSNIKLLNVKTNTAPEMSMVIDPTISSTCLRFRC